jgi:hypothetical protein
MSSEVWWVCENFKIPMEINDKSKVVAKEGGSCFASQFSFLQNGVNLHVINMTYKQ